MENAILEYILKKFETQAACAVQLGWPRQKLNRIVHGESIPSLADVQALAEVLDEPIETIAALFLDNKSRK